MLAPMTVNFGLVGLYEALVVREYCHLSALAIALFSGCIGFTSVRLGAATRYF